MDESIERDSKKIKKARRIKKGLMQDIFAPTGENRKIDELFDKEAWTSGKLPEIASLYSENSSTANGCFYVTTENMNPNMGGIDFGKLTNVPEKAKRFCKGDILFSNLRPYLRKVFLADRDGFCSADILVFKNLTSTRLPFYLISSDNFVRAVSLASYGTKMPRGDKSKIRDYDVRYPRNPKIQKQIATIFERVDAKIELYEQIKTKKERIKKGLMQDLLTGGVRVPEYRDV